MFDLNNGSNNIVRFWNTEERKGWKTRRLTRLQDEIKVLKARQEWLKEQTKQARTQWAKAEHLKEQLELIQELRQKQQARIKQTQQVLRQAQDCMIYWNQKVKVPFELLLRIGHFTLTLPQIEEDLSLWKWMALVPLTVVMFFAVLSLFATGVRFVQTGSVSFDQYEQSDY